MTPDLASLIGSATEPREMQRRTDLREAGWTFWERRTINIHRVVGLFRAQEPLGDVRTLDSHLRGVLARDFKRAWWRGIAYGVVVNVGTFTLTPDDLPILVDAYENNKGTMQWVVLVAGDARQVTGVHTWIEGYLSPVYRTILETLTRQGYQVASVRKEKDGLLRFLTGVANAQMMSRTGRVAFTDFRDPFEKRP